MNPAQFLRRAPRLSWLLSSPMKTLLLLALVVFAVVAAPNLFQANTAAAAAIKSLAGCTANTLEANDDSSTDLVALPFTLNFFGTTYGELYVNNNGNVTFDASLFTYTPFDLLSTTRVIIAPFFADVDTRGDGSDLVTYGDTTFAGRTAFCVNWVNVGYFSHGIDKLNSFQLLLVDRSDAGAGDFDIYFNYDQIQWETGGASGGTGGLGGDSARVGYSNGIDTALELPGSAVNGAFLDSNPSGLIRDSRNSLQNGRYLFPVRGGTAPIGGTISGHVYAVTSDPANAVEGALVQVCEAGGLCNTTATGELGEYRVSGLADGQYEVTAFPPVSSNLVPAGIGPLDLSSGATLSGQDIVLRGPTPPPPEVTIDSRSTTEDGVPSIFWDDPIQLTTTNAPGCDARYEVTKDGTIIASGEMHEISAGTYKATMEPLRPRSGAAQITIYVVCPDPVDSKTVEFDIYIDPSGFVRTLSGDPLVGATVTLYRSDSSAGPFEQLPDGDPAMSPSNRANPDTTDSDGHFGWDVIAGFYMVRAEAEACVSPSDPSQAFVETEVLTIPPPVTDLDLRLACGDEIMPVGDANCDGSVNSIDAAIILQLGAGLLETVDCQAAADANEDGDVNSIDAALILQLGAGLIPALPV